MALTEFHAVGQFGQPVQDRLAVNCLRLIPEASRNHADAILEELKSLVGGLELRPEFLIHVIDDASELLFINGSGGNNSSRVTRSRKVGLAMA